MQTKRKVLLSIAESGTTSNSLNCEDFVNGIKVVNGGFFTLKGIIFPITTGTAFTFEVSEDDVTFYPLKADDNSAISVAKTAGSASAHPLSAQDFAGWSYVRVVSNQTEAAAREIIAVGYIV